MSTSLEGIAKKAKRDNNHRFGNLYGILNEEYLKECWSFIKKDKAFGLDGVSAKEYEKNLDENIKNLVERLIKKQYRAKPVRRKYIPKGKDKMRPLGIPSIEDKFLQLGVSRILSAIYEEDFLGNSYGYRPNKNAHMAIRDIQRILFRGSYHYVVEADIKGYFDNMSHEWLIRMLNQRVNDNSFLRLIKKWLRVGVLEEDGKLIHPSTGSPQGGIISPILANIYMHYMLNLWFEKVVKKHCKGKSNLWIYADDFIAAFENERDANQYLNALKKRLNKFNLELAAEKTNMIKFSKMDLKESGSFDFLGFNFRWRLSHRGKKWLKTTTSSSKLRKSLINIKEWCKKIRHRPLKEIMKTLNMKLKGYFNYYGITGNWDGVHKFYYHMTRILFKWLNRRSQRKSYNWNGFRMMLSTKKIVKPFIRNTTIIK